MRELSVQFYVREPLDRSDWLTEFQAILFEHFSESLEDLKVVRDRSKESYRNIGEDLRGVVRTLYLRDAERRGEPIDAQNPRILAGSVFLENPSRTIEVTLIHDERFLRRAGKRRLFGNSVSVDFKVEQLGHIDEAAIAEFFQRAIQIPGLFYAFACESHEYETKNLDTSSGMRAVGRDLMVGLPGVYWLNFFCNELVQSIGTSKFDLERRETFKQFPNGILVRAFERADQWNEGSSVSQVAAVIQMLGEENFFEKGRTPVSFDGPVTKLVLELE